MNHPMMRMAGGLVDEDDSLITGRVNIKTLSGEIKSIIFDSFASLDDNNTDDCFGLDIDTAMKAMESSSPSRKQHHHPMYEVFSSHQTTNVSSSSSTPCEKILPSTGIKGAIHDDSKSTGSTNSVASANDDSTKPIRPLSAYNLFFQLERERILAGNDHVPFTADDVEKVAIARRLSDMQPDKPKRKHRKSHGKITFAELARAIANRWRALDAHSKGLLIERAALEKKRFLIELEVWTKAHESEEGGDGKDNSSLKEDSCLPIDVRVDSTTSPIPGKPMISHRSNITKHSQNSDVILSTTTLQGRPPMHPTDNNNNTNRTVTPETRMKCAMEMTAFANMRISNNYSPNTPQSQMFFKHRSMLNTNNNTINNFHQSLSYGNSNYNNQLQRQYNNNLTSINSVAVARYRRSLPFQQQADFHHNMPPPNRALSLPDEHYILNSNHRSGGYNNNDGPFPSSDNNGTYNSCMRTTNSPSMMMMLNNNNNNNNIDETYSSSSSKNMEQLLANVEYELNCTKVMASLHRNQSNNLQFNNNNNNNNCNNDNNIGNHQYM